MVDELQYETGDVIKFNGVAMLYQSTYSAGELKESNVGIVVKKIPFDHNDRKNPNDCEDVSDGSIIQTPEFVYTVLSNGVLIEVLDIDVKSLLSGISYL